GPVQGAGKKMQGEISGSRTDFQDRLADVRSNAIRHPAREPRSAPQTIRNLTCSIAIEINEIGNSKTNDNAESFYTVFPTDFFSFLISAAGIANRYFEN